MKILGVKAIMKLSLVFTLCLCLDCTSGRTIDSIIASASSLGTIKSGMKQDTAGSAVLTELDILLTPDQYNALYGKHNTVHANSSTTSARETREASKPLYKRWTNKRVPYRIEAGQFSSQDQEEIKAAIEHWEEYTCITFPLATDDDLFSINFENSTMCASYVGMIGGSQALSLAPVCRQKRVIIHEIGHAIGFTHEHLRPDRDDYVIIKQENMQPLNIFLFLKDDFSEAIRFRVPYDYRSIMHYGGTVLSRNGEPTIVTRDPAFQKVIGHQKTLSFNDIKLANLMYKCNEHCSSSITCPKEGFLGKDCQCWCPGNPVKECEENIATESTPVKPTLKPTVPPTETTECRDLIPYCLVYAKLGYCQGIDYVETHCKASCSLCEGDIVTERPPVKPTLKPTEEPITRPTERPTTRLTEGPTTRPTDGPTTRPKDRPTTRPTERPATRPTEGPTTRPTEGPATRPTCTDTNHLCPIWAKRKNYCKNSPYIKKSCKASCSLCEGDIVTEPPPVTSTLKTTERQTTRPTEAPTTRPTMRPTVTTKCRDMGPDCQYLALLAHCRLNYDVEPHCQAPCFLCAGSIVFFL